MKMSTRLSMKIMISMNECLVNTFIISMLNGGEI